MFVSPLPFILLFYCPFFSSRLSSHLFFFWFSPSHFFSYGSCRTLPCALVTHFCPCFPFVCFRLSCSSRYLFHFSFCSRVCRVFGLIVFSVSVSFSRVCLVFCIVSCQFFSFFRNTHFGFRSCFCLAPYS